MSEHGLKPCPSCGSPHLYRITHHNDPCSAITCGECGFGAATEEEWNNANTPLMQALKSRQGETP